MKQWYRMQAPVEDPTVAEIHIIDFIGDWVDDYLDRMYGERSSVTARAFVEQLAQLPATVKSLRVHINSPGGDVFAALNIANALREQQMSKGRTVVTIVDGLAASAASIILMAGSVIQVADNALVMVHNPWSYAIGSATDMRKVADELDIVRNTIVATYQWHSSLTPEAIMALLDAETWMDADQAIANGFATEKVAGLKAAASLDGRVLAKLSVPDQFKARVASLAKKVDPAPAPAAAADVMAICAEAGCSLDFTRALVVENLTADAARARAAEDKTTRAAAAARATDITALCERAKVPELAATYIAGAMTVDAVCAQLTTITAKLDRVEIDAHLDPSTGSRSTPRIDHAAVYAERNRRVN
jgi:ATP-dependent protease ClpP protease subunit